ncbi:MAG TPA: T9SS type A sorting domain-containing protein [Rhodothermales bacterium]|nr:T9SS type A sorting domain-containing protein [Rhodothermales bacterium]
MKHLLVSVAGALLVVGASMAVNLQPVAQIEVVAWSPDELHHAGLSTHPSTGLSVVGVGELTYLRGHETAGEEVTSYAWTLSSRPNGSSAALDSTNLQGTTFRPDVEGQYIIDLTIATAGGSSSANVTITAAKYVGVGSIGGATPDRTKGQCAACHSGNTNEWAETGHATMFTEAIDGLKSDHYNSNCVECHTVGYNVDPEADNGGFDDVAAALGWMFPATLEQGNWQDIVDNYPALAQVSNIQCENCHGPGSQHFGDVRTIEVSIDEGVCGRCHEEEPYHVKNAEWKFSKHGSGTTFARGTSATCAPCHSGWGGIANLEPSSNLELTSGNVPITCAVCHDPHSAEHEFQLRNVEDVTLMNGEVVRFGGNGRLCMNCHKSRVNADTYTNQYAPRYGPHYSNQTDMLAGTNVATFGRDLPNSTHRDAVPDLCVGCHMAEAPSGVGEGMLGGHTWNMHLEDPDTPEEPLPGERGYHDGILHFVEPCQPCHGQIQTFDDLMARDDYDGDGEVESAKAEIQGLLNRVAMLLPPLGDTTVVVAPDYNSVQLKAAFNWIFVHEDGSHGLHNFRFATSLLQLSEQVLLYGVLSPGTIAAVKDVPNDQGKQVEVIWTRFGGDGPSDNPIQIYYVWRLSESSVSTKTEPTYKSLEAVPADKVDAGATLAHNDGIWTAVASQPAAQMELYSAIAPTLYDSTSTILVETTFMVSGHTSDSQIFVRSEPVSGYSIDNLAPQAPSNVAQYTGSYWVRVTWDDPVDEDFNYFEVYRSTRQGFNPNTVLPLKRVTSPEYSDETIEVGNTYYYRVAAYDFAGNRSRFSDETSPAVVTGTETTADVPEHFALHQNYPNPFNPTTTVGYDVPVSGKVSMMLFDVVGRPIRVLVDGQVAAGRHKVTIDAGSLPSGTYFLRMLTEDGVFERTVTLLK